MLYQFVGYTFLFKIVHCYLLGANIVAMCIVFLWILGQNTFKIARWMHIEVAHFLSHNAHFCNVSFLWTHVMNSKTYQINNLKLIIH